jgi:dehydrogenase/reductase SDR family member 12
MDLTSVIDTVLDRSVVLGYGRPGYDIRRQLPGWPADPPRLDGKVVLVTGAGSGIGQAAAAGFTRLGASVLALARNQERADQAARLIRSKAEAGRGAGTGPLGDVRGVACDLSSLAEVYAFTDWLSQHEQRLDVLVNNAGVMPGERTRTVDGVELTFATHVLAPWVLTEQLTPLLLAAAPSRVINVTSGGQYDQKIPAGDLESDDLRYGPKRVYARTKREELVLTQQWAQLWPGPGCTSTRCTRAGPTPPGCRSGCRCSGPRPGSSSGRRSRARTPSSGWAAPLRRSRRPVFSGMIAGRVRRPT